jgi:REP element-mobilizing transposase RayT
MEKNQSGYKSSVTKQIGLLGFAGKLWQRNYYEIIIRNEYDHKRISNYILNNPAKWDKAKFY